MSRGLRLLFEGVRHSSRTIERFCMRDSYDCFPGIRIGYPRMAGQAFRFLRLASLHRGMGMAYCKIDGLSHEKVQASSLC